MNLSAEHVGLINGAIAFELISRCADGFSTVTIQHACASALRRLIEEPQFRDACLATHSELFTAKDAPEKLAAIIEEVRKWQLNQFRQESLSALGTADTPPTSREKHTKP